MSLGRHEGWDIVDKQVSMASSSLVMGGKAVAWYSDTGRQEDKAVEAVEGRTTLGVRRRKKVLEVWGEIRTCEIALRGNWVNDWTRDGCLGARGPPVIQAGAESG